MNLKAIVLVLGAAGVSFGLVAPVVGQSSRQPVSSEQRSESLAGERPRTASVLRRAFPAEFAQVNASYTAVYGSGTRAADNLLATSRIMNKLREAYAQQVRNAPDDNLKQVVTALRDLHVAVQSSQPAAICGELALNGTADLFARERAGSYLEALDILSAVYMQAAASGRTASSSTPTAKPEDWSELAQFAIRQGSPQANLEAVMAADPSNPNTCVGMIDLLGAVIDMPGEPGHRLRAELAVSAAVY